MLIEPHTQSRKRTHRTPWDGLTLKMLREPGGGEDGGVKTGSGGTVQLVVGASSKEEHPAALHATNLKCQVVPAGAGKQCLISTDSSKTRLSRKFEFCAISPL